MEGWECVRTYKAHVFVLVFHVPTLTGELKTNERLCDKNSCRTFWNCDWAELWFWAMTRKTVYFALASHCWSTHHMGMPTCHAVVGWKLVGHTKPLDGSVKRKGFCIKVPKTKISHAAISRLCWSSIHEWKHPERSTWQLGLHGIVFLCVTGERRIKLFNSVVSLIQFGLKCLVDVLVWIQSIKQKLPLYRKALTKGWVSLSQSQSHLERFGTF